ncbi:MAG TPA: nucleotide sugar dehydrogenase [Planctomycetaceae bacterium]|nr:nucleotide sugar dehydrogenase [Planctomycetaceae bacterium]
MTKIAVFGMGYVGCVSAACLARDGHRVIGVDIDTDKVGAIQSGRSPVFEPGLDELIRGQVAAERLTATRDAVSAVRQTEMGLVAVGTPSRADGSVEMAAIERVVESIGRALYETGQPYTVVIRSTLLPGLLEEHLAPLLERAAGRPLGTDLHLCNNPEFLRETTAIRDYDHPPFIVVGADGQAEAEPVFELYRSIRAERIWTDTRTAALVKYACNAFHALKIDFANEIGTLAGAFGADGQRVMQIVCRDRQLNISAAYLRPGFAFGGSCLPKDVRALVRFAQRAAIDTPLLGAILPSNRAHLERALAMIRQTGCRRVGLVGLSFKAGTDDLRESPQVILAETLLGRGYDLKIYDPGVRTTRLVGTNLAYVDVHLPHLAALLVDDPEELLGHAELLVLATGVADRLQLEGRFLGEILDLRRDLVVAKGDLVPGGG